MSEDNRDTDASGPGDPDPGKAAVRHVLQEVFPDRLEASVIGSTSRDGTVLVGVKAAPRGYFSTAKYALVTVDAAGQVVDAESTTRGDVARELGGADE
ncbi:hypothetical protein BRD00_09740 [Halobacteriales archaeon QS_8_69_26]|nr:MAG: hypothetical protein BRD00_09740 [Halobacteriales archaeon QS_8_69_26]